MSEIDNKIKIYDHTDQNDDFKEINYKTSLSTKLHPKRTFIKGELQKVEWYSEYDGITYVDKVLECTIVYARDILGFAVSRTTTRTWFHVDDTPCEDTKVTIKYYTDSLESMSEGKRRRGNLISILMYDVMGLMIQTMIPGDETDPAVVVQIGRDFLKDNQEEITAFVQESHTDFKTTMLTIPDTWLDYTPAALGGSVSIRAYIINELTV